MTVTMPGAAEPIKLLTSIESLAASREAWLTDIWGVMHNGVEPFAPAADACARFRLQGGIVLLLSNAPRPAPSVMAQLDRIGVPRFAYDAILSSGDAARLLVGRHKGNPVFHLGPERDLALYEGLGVRLTSAEEAVAVSCTGLFDDEVETPEDYAEQLKDFARRKLPMVCANPDLAVERGHRIIPCAGALAKAYEALGGSVAYAGKPFLPVYDLAFEMLAKIKGRAIARSNVLAIGDGIGTDIKGAHAAGIDSVYIASGVHAGAGFDERAATALFAGGPERPIAAMSGLAW